ncbi:formylglycine-generating enzyme family protein [Sorangium sp. So ce854]|uniref:formylglycine-generating enzyme family protein n=1 Tax=Sorangium sp. So ce854 TaxID=3133322 RepID=UPI003F5DE7D8
MRSKRAAWWWAALAMKASGAALAFMASGCTALAGLDKDYHPLAGAGSDAGGSGSGSGSNGGGDGAGTGGAGHGGGECAPDEARCADNQVERCGELGRWDAPEPCPGEAPLCRGGSCAAPPSCDGLPSTCGPGSDEGCCATAMVPGGSFQRSNDAASPATVSGFLLDRFEVTVGRFRSFVEAYPGSQPAADAGAHPGIPGSGWDPAWGGALPTDAAALRAAVRCTPDNPDMPTWTDEPGAHEHLPMNCVSWYVAFAFCAWDGGRLPTEAEWNHAAAGGSEQRQYPWSRPPESTEIDASYASYDCGESAAPGCTFQSDFSDIVPVGSRSPKGDGRWAQADLGGSMREWTLDGFGAYPNPCVDCANLRDTAERVVRGGSAFGKPNHLLSSERVSVSPSTIYYSLGFRCARTP